MVILVLRFSFFQSHILPILYYSRSGMGESDLSSQFYIFNTVAWAFVISPPMSALLTHLLQFIKNLGRNSWFCAYFMFLT